MTNSTNESGQVIIRRIVDEDTLREALDAMAELRTVVRRLSSAFSEAVRVLDEGDTGQDTEDTDPPSLSFVLCPVPIHAWGGTHPHQWTGPAGQLWMCPGA
jgi:hypothetical protein